MALVAPDPRASLSLTESNRQHALINLQRTRSRAHDGGAGDDDYASTIPEVVGHDHGPGDRPNSLSLRPSRFSQAGPDDIETKWTAWLCVLSSFLFLAPSYGFMQSIGAVQSYLSLNQLADYTDRDIGWITGLYTFMALFLGIQTGPIVDVYGPRKIAPLATLCTVPMFFILAECTQYWHFMLCLGVLGGIGGAICSTLAVATIGKLFVRLRGLAMGVALAGSSTGGIIFPLLLRDLLPRYGFKWAFRVLGFVILAIMIGACVCVWPYDNLMTPADNALRNDTADTERATPEDDPEANTTATTPAATPKRSAGINFTAFRSPPFSFVTLCFFLLEFVIFGVTGMLPTLVVFAGFPPEAGYVMVAILNGASCLGRIIPGLIGDRLGHFNVLIAMMAVTLVFTATTLLPFGDTHIEALYVFSGLWGFGSGSFLSLTPVCMGKTCEAKDYGRYYGTMNFVVSFGLLITVPIGGQMLQSMGAQALSGLYLAILCLGGVSAFAARSLLIGTWFHLKAKI